MIPTRTNFFGIVFRLCVDQIWDSNASGRVFSRRLAAPVQFNDLIHLFLLLDELMDKQRFPQAFKDLRTFSSGRQYLPDALCAKDLASGMGEEEVLGSSGSCATYALYVASRRNATWQGQLDLLDGSEPHAFTSVEDLLHTLDEKVFSQQEANRPLAFAEVF